MFDSRFTFSGSTYFSKKVPGCPVGRANETLSPRATHNERPHHQLIQTHQLYAACCAESTPTSSPRIHRSHAHLAFNRNRLFSDRRAKSTHFNTAHWTHLYWIMRTADRTLSRNVIEFSTSIECVLACNNQIAPGCNAVGLFWLPDGICCRLEEQTDYLGN